LEVRSIAVLRRFPGLALLTLFVLLFVLFSAFARRFLTSANIEDILAGYSFMAILAIGQAFPIIARGVDLSVGSNVGLGAMILFDLNVIFAVPGWAAIPIAIAVCALAGALNGLLVTVLRLQPFVATLATLAAYRGGVYAISGRQLYPAFATQSIRDPWIRSLEAYVDLGRWIDLARVVKLPSIPLSFFVLMAVAAAAQIVLARTRFGLDLKTVGGNREAAHLAGISVNRIQVASYALSGLSAGVVAVILVARFTTATEAAGTGMELTTIAAAVIGGVSLQGGTGNAVGPVLGAFLLGIILIGLTLMGISQFTQQILTGLILLGAIWYDRATWNREEAAAAKHG
jgi:ribose/xylose/arabinose/galactoside ABC-type transport system permease subunit